MVVLQLYFDKITELTVNKSGSILFKEALMSLATDPGLHPLVPYFTYFIADEVIMIPYYHKLGLNNFHISGTDVFCNHIRLHGI